MSLVRLYGIRLPVLVVVAVAAAAAAVKRQKMGWWYSSSGATKKRSLEFARVSHRHHRHRTSVPGLRSQNIGIPGVVLHHAFRWPFFAVRSRDRTRARSGKGDDDGRMSGIVGRQWAGGWMKWQL